MSRSGRYVQQSRGYKAFIPAPLPPNPPLMQDEELLLLSSNAERAVGKLSGLSSIISDPDIFVYLYVRKEALLSSQIEGTQCSLEDILNPEKGEGPVHDIEEVSNYVHAMNKGLLRLEDLPVSTRLIKEMHAVLMKGVRGSHKTPGEFRQSQNWIGRPGATLNDAEFVPPPSEEVDKHMSDIENFIHRESKIPPLIKAALVHAQFETVHPFLDGNGRLGRLLITYLLCYWKVLDRPLLYLSYFFKAHRSEYYSKLMDVRLKGDWEGWIKFFLRAVAEAADMANAAAIEIHKLHQLDGKKLSKSTAYTHQVFVEFCHYPILNNPTLIRKHKSSAPKVQRALDALVALKIIREISGKQRNRLYSYDKYLAILNRDTNMKMG